MRNLTRKNSLIAYAQDFVSYLLMEKYMENYEIRNIILYGSVVRGDFTEHSDIDIFIDVNSTDEKMKELVKGTVRDFYGSLWFQKWKRLGIKNTISCLSGRLDGWKDLERSMISNGRVLYGNYRPETKGKLASLFYVESVKPESKRVFISRKLFGYVRYGKKYAGLVQRHDGEKVGRSCFLIPMEFTQKILQFFRQNKVKATIREIALL